ncbi:hypothetical protein [Mesorhizobium sp. M0977]|uniref:hypothetical protein n=1 Tax=Mesorhizobium sp. M0977 TaxID=2957039 RepID=UPI00333C2D01
MTNLPVEDLSAAVEKLGWYALRWKAEVFHKVMKSGCRAEEARLETAERLAKFLALIAVVSWRIFFITMSARAKPDAAPDSVLTFAEITGLDRIDASRTRPRLQRPTLAAYLLQIAMLGGYLARNHDPPPGNMVVWRHDPLARHRLRHLHWIKPTMWVIGSFAGWVRRAASDTGSSRTHIRTFSPNGNPFVADLSR